MLLALLAVVSCSIPPFHVYGAPRQNCFIWREEVCPLSIHVWQNQRHSWLAAHMTTQALACRIYRVCACLSLTDRLRVCRELPRCLPELHHFSLSRPLSNKLQLSCMRVWPLSSPTTVGLRNSSIPFQLIIFLLPKGYRVDRGTLPCYMGAVGADFSWTCISE